MVVEFSKKHLPSLSAGEDIDSGLSIFNSGSTPTEVTIRAMYDRVDLADVVRTVTVAANSTNDGAHNVSMYSLGEAGTSLEFISQFETPGLASSVVIYNGRAFVADSAAGALNAVAAAPSCTRACVPDGTVGSATVNQRR